MLFNPLRLTDAKIARITELGMYAVGGGLYLHVSSATARQWIFRYRRNGKRRDMGLGSTSVRNLDQARAAALRCRQLIAEGADPIESRRHTRLQHRMAAAKSVTFSECMALYAKQHHAGWSANYSRKWGEILERYAVPVLGPLPIAAVDDQLLRQILRPIWNEIPTTAGKLRGWIEKLIDFAVGEKLRPEGPNPARWEGGLKRSFPPPKKVKRPEHRLSLPYTEASAFFARLMADKSEVAKAMAMIVLTGGRKDEVLRASWGQFDFVRKVWSIPGNDGKTDTSHMKQDAAHHVPLSCGMVDLLEEMRQRCGGYPLPTALVFPSSQTGKRLHPSAPQYLLRRYGLSSKATVHGFRSTLEVFIAECTVLSTEARKLMIAHSIGDETDAAYMRSDLLDQRCHGGEAWSNWLRGRPIDPAIARPRSLAAPRVA
jgi:integrase